MKTKHIHLIKIGGHPTVQVKAPAGTAQDVLVSRAVRILFGVPGTRASVVDDVWTVLARPTKYQLARTVFSGGISITCPSRGF